MITSLRTCVQVWLLQGYDLVQAIRDAWLKKFTAALLLLCMQGFNLTRTVLVDNDDYKAADGEHENMLHIPHWEQTPGMYVQAAAAARHTQQAQKCMERCCAYLIDGIAVVLLTSNSSTEHTLAMVVLHRAPIAGWGGRAGMKALHAPEASTG